MVFENISINMWLVFVAVISLLIAGISLNWVNRTIGIKFAIQLFRMTKKKNKNKILLKIWTLSGKPQYQIKNVANLIEYEFKENGKMKTGLVMYDYYSKYTEFANIPIIECDPNDVVPRNPFVNSKFTISGQILKKNMVDSAKEDLVKDNIKQWVKLAVPIIVVVGIIMILYSQNQSDALAECMRVAINAKSAVITGS